MTSEDKSCICAIARHEEPYIKEWIKYHVALGISHIYLYDNSIDHSLLKLLDPCPPYVTIVLCPGESMQYKAYNHYLQSDLSWNHKWCIFLDIDEFIVLKKHADVNSFLSDYLTKGSLALSWFMYGEGPKNDEDKNKPVTERFTWREPTTNMHVKCFFLRPDVQYISCAHFPVLLEGVQKDTNGKVFEGPFNVGGPSDVAYINHYFFKSTKEFKDKCSRIGSDGEKKTATMAHHPDRNLVQDVWAMSFYKKCI
jgi:hypothetical protein